MMLATKNQRLHWIQLMENYRESVEAWSNCEVYGKSIDETARLAERMRKALEQVTAYEKVTGIVMQEGVTDWEYWIETGMIR